MKLLVRSSPNSAAEFFALVNHLFLSVYVIPIVNDQTIAENNGLEHLLIHITECVVSQSKKIKPHVGHLCCRVESCADSSCLRFPIFFFSPALASWL